VKELTLGEVRTAKTKAKSKTATRARGKAAVTGAIVDSGNLDHYLGVRRFDFGR
jgi:ATP-dependent Lon protease